MSVRVVKHAAGVTELFVNGASMHNSIQDVEVTRMVRVRVVGTAADFSYVPVGLTGLSFSYEAPVRCVFCAPTAAGR